MSGCEFWMACMKNDSMKTVCVCGGGGGVLNHHYQSGSITYLFYLFIYSIYIAHYSQINML